MGKLISKEEAIEALGARPISWTDSDYELGRQNQYDEDMTAILDIPSIDLVMCKDCKWKHGIHCEWRTNFISSDDFCSWAERRIDERTD